MGNKKLCKKSHYFITMDVRKFTASHLITAKFEGVSADFSIATDVHSFIVNRVYSSVAQIRWEEEERTYYKLKNITSTEKR